jgi:hypothetical protein
MRFNNKLFVLTLLFTVIGMVSCDEALDINESPNNPASSTPALTLPSGMLYSGQTVGLDFALVSGFIAQYWTQSPQAGQYEVYDRYNYNGKFHFSRLAELLVWGDGRPEVCQRTRRGRRIE